MINILIFVTILTLIMIIIMMMLIVIIIMVTCATSIEQFAVLTEEETPARTRPAISSGRLEEYMMMIRTMIKR